MTDMVQIAKSTARMVWSPDSWINNQALNSAQTSRYFSWAAWAEFAASLACLFLWYCYYLSVRTGSSPLQYLGVKILLCAVGAAGASGSILLSKGMRAFWKRYDTSSERARRFWYWVMTLSVGLGCAPYYHLVYRPQVEGRVLESK
jgi:hypothetical protein